MLGMQNASALAMVDLVLARVKQYLTQLDPKKKCFSHIRMLLRSDAKALCAERRFLKKKSTPPNEPFTNMLACMHCFQAELALASQLHPVKVVKKM